MNDYVAALPAHADVLRDYCGSGDLLMQKER